MKTQAELALIQQNDGSGIMPEVTNNKVDARAVHEALEVATPFHMWFKRRVEEFGFLEGEDFFPPDQRTNLFNRADFLLTLDMAKELAMVERNEAGRKMRRYFIECEKRLVNSDGHRPPLQAIPDSVLLKLQTINAGVIEAVMGHASRIEKLETAAKPGLDWCSVGEWIETRPEEAAGLPFVTKGSPQHRALYSLISCGAKAYSVRHGLAIGHMRTKVGCHIVRTFAPRAIAHAVAKKTQTEGGTES